MPNPDFFISPPSSGERQKHYKGHVTARAAISSIIDAGELDHYTAQELAEKLGCSVRTVANYIGMLSRTELADIEPEQLPLTTTRGRMLIMTDREYGNCDDCPFGELCKFMVWRDGFLACEKPLIEEVAGDPEPEPDPFFSIDTQDDLV